MTPEELAGLRAAVEKKYGRPLIVHGDFELFHNELGFKISSQTLKRVWGYNKDHKSISTKTVDILAQYL